MRAGPTARGQGGKPRYPSPGATQATRPLTARWARYHEESDAGQLDKRSRYVSAPDAAGRGQGRSGPAVSGKAVTGRERDAAGRHNVTPRSAYRTALLSDRPTWVFVISAPAAGETAKRTGRPRSGGTPTDRRRSVRFSAVD